MGKEVEATADKVSEYDVPKETATSISVLYYFSEVM